MSDEQYLQQHLNVIEGHLRCAIADIVRAKPAEPLAGLIEALVRQKPETPLAPVCPAKKGTWTAVDWISTPEVSAILAAALLPQPVANELDAMRDLGRLGRTELHSTLRARLVMGSDALASLLAPKISALANTDVATGEELHSKFSEQGAYTLKHLDLNAFFAGLERVIGAPSPGSMDDVLDAMEAEHLHGSESDEVFVTANYGVRTSSATEWRFVVTPGAPPNGGWPFETINTSIADDAPGAPAGEHRSKSIKRVTMPRDELLQRVRARNERLKKIGEPELVDAEVLAARLYTGPVFYKYNAVLRGLDTDSYTAPPLLKNTMVRLCCPEATHDAYIGTAVDAPWREANGKLSYVDCLQTLNKYTTTLHCINSAIVKVGKLTHACVVYRGVSGGKLPDSFWVPDEFGCRGGVEPGFMSTTQSLAVATGYASNQLATAGMVIESVLGMTNRGADIGWLSQYPHEREILMPPLTCLEVEGTRAEGLLVVKTKLSINLTSPTIERVIGKMKGSHLDLLRILHTKLAKVSPTAAQKLHGLEEEAAKLSVEFYNGAEAYKERTNLALDVKGRLEFEELDASLRSAAKFEFVFGSLEQLYANLSSVLSPPPDGASDEQLRQLMQAEHCEGPNHNVAFTASSPESGGKLHTSSEVEWYYVVDPTPERLATLSLAPSIVGALDSISDPCKLGGAVSGGPQLGAMVPLTAWPSEAQHPPYSTGEATAEKPVGAGAPPRASQPRPLSDFAEECRARNMQLAKLGLPPLLTAELIGMRLYTGVMGKSVYNVALRALCGLPGWFHNHFEHRLQRNPYATTMHCVNRGLLKLGKVCCLEARTRNLAGLIITRVRTPAVRARRSPRLRESACGAASPAVGCCRALFSSLTPTASAAEWNLRPAAAQARSRWR